jgi:hypothetical protein
VRRFLEDEILGSLLGFGDWFGTPWRVQKPICDYEITDYGMLWYVRCDVDLFEFLQIPKDSFIGRSHLDDYGYCCWDLLIIRYSVPQQKVEHLRFAVALCECMHFTPNQEIAAGKLVTFSLEGHEILGRTFWVCTSLVPLEVG